MKVSRSKTRSRKDSAFTVINDERKRTAGRRGTKNFVDPTKLFVGNVPFDATESDLLGWFGERLGSTHNVESLKIIHDWKTGKSKGYGFVNFMDPMCATVAMELLNGKKFMGRILRISQGQKAKGQKLVVVKDRTEEVEASDKEGAAIEEGLDAAETGVGKLETLITLDDSGESDLLLFGDDGVDDDEILGQDDDDDEFDFDGVFEEMYKTKYEPLTEEEQALNREKRRELQQARKKRKLPHKGFG